MTSDIDHFFNPRSIAVIGVSRNPRKFGHIIFRNLNNDAVKTDAEGVIRSASSVFDKKVFPVNPKADEILGKKCYRRISDIGEPVDLAVIVVPAESVMQSVVECREKGVKAAVIITSGFAEAGNAAGEEAVKKAAGSMRVVGPNVIGIYDAYSGVDTVFNLRHRQQRPRPGNIAFISQSGAFGSAALDLASFDGIGISKFVSLGNMADVNETDMLSYLLSDEKTGVICMYVEGSKDYRALYSKLKSSRKPVIVVKAGKTSQTRKAVASHTASMAGESRIFSGMLRQSGALETDAESLFDMAKIFSQPVMRNSRVHVVTDGGGFGILAADALVQNGMRLSKLSDKAVAKIRGCVPSYATVSNPLDLTGDADNARYKSVLPLVLGDKNVDALLVILLMQISSLDSDIVEVLASQRRFGKPVIVCMAGGEYTNLHRKMLEEKGIPTYSYPERAVSALAGMYRYQKMKRLRSQE